MHKIAITLICLLLASCVVYPPNLNLQHESTRVPQIPESWKDEPVIVLSDTTVMVVTSLNQKNLIRHKSITYYYVNKRNPTLLETMYFPEYVGLENRPLVTVTVMYPDGSFWKTGTATFKTSPRYYSDIYKSDDLNHRFTFPRYVKGMIIRCEVKRTINTPEHIWHEFIRGGYNTLKKYTRFTYPEDYSITYLVSNNENISMDTNHIEHDGHSSLIITADTLKKFQENNRLKQPERWYSGLHVSVPPAGKVSYTWQQLGDFYLKSIAHAMTSSQKIKELAASIRHTQKDSIIAEAFRLIQHKIRYLADMEGFHSFIPRAAPIVLQKGYGDCKEMSTLLKMILREKGIEVHLASVTTEGTTQCFDQVPTLGNFNHIIVCHRNQNNTLRFYDPTVVYGTAQDSYFHLIGQSALLLQQNGSKLYTIEKDPNYTNEISTRSKIKKSPASGKWSLEGTIILKGRTAYKLFPLFDDVKGEEIPPFLIGFLDEIFNLKAISSTIKTLSSKQITVTFTANFQHNYLAMDKGGFLLDAPSIFGGDARYTTLDNEGPRYFTDLVQHDAWEVPPGFRDLEKSDLEHWIAQGNWKRKGTVVSRSFSLNSTDVPYSKRSEAHEYYKMRKKFSKTTVWK